MFRFAEFLSKCTHGSICGNFIVFHSLSSTYQCGIQQSIFKVFSQYLRAFLYQTFHSPALFTFGIFTKHSEDLFEALYMTPSLFEMLLKTFSQLFRRRSFSHLG